ncbi:hypothetical protein [Commensalibacter communis]|nr:hypothetical protein [Commensalibacter communis]CAI3933740.1 unnamed protein product [Commensalibacter communis]CAI3944473.1 unnamed protein product [Commensalibacter communis]
MAAKESGYKWSKFYWDDWANDGALQSCNLTAQGLWMHLLRVMFNNERQGYLQINNKAMSALQLSKLTGLDSRTIKKQLSILIENNVCSVDENGIVFSRRMVRECQSKNRKSNVSATSTQHKRSDDATSMQQPCSEGVTCTQEEIPENSQKQDSLNKNRTDKNREEKNKSSNTPQPPKEIEVIKTDQEVVVDCVNELVQITGLQDRQCKMFVEGWLKDLNGEVHTLAHCIDRGMSGRNPINLTRWYVKNHSKITTSNVTVLQPKTNKERMTEEMGLCKNIAEFEAQYPTEDIPNDYNDNRFARRY